MGTQAHPYYEGLRRWIEANPAYSVSSLATKAGLNNATIRRGLEKWHAPSATTADKIKEVIGLNYDEVVALATGREVPRFNIVAAMTGFSDSDVTAWVGKQDDPINGKVRDMAGLLSGGKGGRDVWLVGSRAMILAGYVEGDFLLVDQHKAATAGSGDVVIAQVYDFDVGAASTLLRRYDPPVLQAASTDPADWKTHVVDGRNVKIMGVVTASWRTTTP